MNKLFIAVLVAVSFSVLLGSQEAFSDTFTVNTDQPSYVEGDTIIVSGITLPIIPDTLVTLLIIASNGNLVVIAQLEVAPDGSYGSTFTSGGPLWSSEGTYTVKSQYGDAIVETTFEYVCPTCPEPPIPPENPNVTVMTDRDCYILEDRIEIFGEALPFSNFPVTLVVVASNGNIVAIAQIEVAPDETYTLELTSGGPLWSSEGTYRVISQYGDAVVETTFELFFDECPIVVGGELIPIETTSLLLAGAQTFSWMIPVVLSILGIGLFVVSRKSE